VIEDFKIVQRVRAGQRDEYAHLVRKYQERVLRLCTSLLSHATVAEDAAQEIFLKAYQALDSFRGDASFSTWLYRMPPIIARISYESAAARRPNRGKLW